MAITVRELIEQLSKYRPEAEVGIHSSLEGVVRSEQGEDGLVVLLVEGDLNDDDDDDDEGDDDEEGDDLEDDICPRCDEEETDCIC